jgi:hypothetical protein
MLPIPFHPFSTRDEIYPQAVKKGDKDKRLPRKTGGPWSQAVGKDGAAA